MSQWPSGSRRQTPQRPTSLSRLGPQTQATHRSRLPRLLRHRNQLPTRSPSPRNTTTPSIPRDIYTTRQHPKPRYTHSRKKTIVRRSVIPRKISTTGSIRSQVPSTRFLRNARMCGLRCGMSSRVSGREGGGYAERRDEDRAGGCNHRGGGKGEEGKGEVGECALCYSLHKFNELNSSPPTGPAFHLFTTHCNELVCMEIAGQNQAPYFRQLALLGSEFDTKSGRISTDNRTSALPSWLVGCCIRSPLRNIKSRPGLQSHTRRNIVFTIQFLLKRL